MSLQSLLDLSGSKNKKIGIVVNKKSIDEYILANQIVKKLLNAEFTITDRRYIGYETETGYHHYVVDAAKHYEMEE